MNETRSSTENVQVSPDLASLISQNLDRDSEGFVISSSFVRTAILMGMADENAAKTGGEPFRYADEETRTICGAWYEGFRRARTDPKFWDLFDKTLSSSCKSYLGFDQIGRPNEVTA